MICKVYVLLIGRVNLHIFHRLLILKFVSKPQLDQFLWVTGNVVNTESANESIKECFMLGCCLDTG